MLRAKTILNSEPRGRGGWADVRVAHAPSQTAMSQTESNAALLVDLYELTMAAGYFEQHVDCRASFELFVRHLPPVRSYLVAAGVEAALNYLEDLAFTEEDIRFLRSEKVFRAVSGSFFDYLRKFRFTGDVCAVPEGSLVFAEEPILQVTAPVLEAQIVETFLLSVVNFETLIASKAARVVRAAGGRGVLEFGSRRAHGPEAGVRAARAAYVGGCMASSNVEAGRRYNIPLVGTAAHSWTQVFPTERQSFEALVKTFPENAILLIDTYDSLMGARTAVALGKKIAGVRLDSGDLLEKSRQVRRILDEGGLRNAIIVASGDLSEDKIERLVREEAPIDVFGVGTELSTSKDWPALGVVYKLVESEQDGRVEYKTKFSEEKVYSPGKKQVFRYLKSGMYDRDVIARSSENFPEAVPLLEKVMERGRRLVPPTAAPALRARTLGNLARLPGAYHALRDAPPYPVLKSAALNRLLEQVREEYFSSQNSPPAVRA
jgi:nicotinate phosphoribosyltransferase